MFTEKDYAKPIPENMSIVIRRYTNRDDMANAAAAGDVSPSLVKQVIFRISSLTKNNSAAIEALVKTALANCEDSIVGAIEDKDFLKNLLEEEN